MSCPSTAQLGISIWRHQSRPDDILRKLLEIRVFLEFLYKFWNIARKIYKVLVIFQNIVLIYRLVPGPTGDAYTCWIRCSPLSLTRKSSCIANFEISIRKWSNFITARLALDVVVD